MAILFVIRIPGWRNFTIYVPGGGQFSHDALHFFQRTFRSRLFREIERGNDERALRLGTRWRLRWLRGEWGETALDTAINHGRSELACEFVRRGGARHKDGSLASAAMKGDVAVIQALLSIGVPPDESRSGVPYGGNTPLKWAINRRHAEAAKLLIAAGADVNAISDSKYTVAHSACGGSDGDIRMLEVLLPHKPNIQVKDFRGGSVLQAAVTLHRRGKPETFNLIKAYYPELDLEAALESEANSLLPRE